MKKRKMMSLLISAAMAVSALAGGTTMAVSAEETVELNMWAGLTGADADAMQGMLEEFMEENPNIKVSFTSVTWSEIFAKWQQAFGSDLGPDVMLMHTTDICNYAPNNMLMPLNDIVTSIGVEASDYSEAVWNGAQYDGTQYGIPLDFHCMGVFKNVKMFEEAGLDPNMEFKTEEDFLAACEALSDPENGKYAVGIGSNYAHTYRYWYSLLHQYGGSFTDAEFTEAQFASEEGKKALEWIAALPLELEYAPFNEQDIDADFLNGTCAMVIDGPWFNPSVIEAGMEYTTTAFPQIGDNMAVWANSHTLTIPVENGRSEEDQTAAETLVSWIIDHSYEWGAKSGQIPANAQVQNSDEYKASEVYPYVQAFIDESPYVVYEPLCAGTSKFGADNEVWGVLSAITNVVSGNTDDVTGELEIAAASVTSILNE